MLLLMPDTAEITRDNKEGLKQLQLAASKNHAVAQYALGLIFVDGTETYYSCELGVKYLQSAMRLGNKTSRKLLS